jgi:prepilin-type N-terminal cleavage/methylation domain-containing protein
LNTKRSGFTLIELMVALVVGGIILAGLVALSGSVQRSFSRSKDITELQSNLRFAMKTLVEDFGRTSFMTTPDATKDTCHSTGNAPVNFKAISYDPATGFTLRGNFLSTRDEYYRRISATTGKIDCRDKQPFVPAMGNMNAGLGSGLAAYDPYLVPFTDGASFADAFAAGRTVRLDVGDRRYFYTTVNAVDPVNNALTLRDSIDMNFIRGNNFWINPITERRYQVVNKGGPANNQRWVLERTDVLNIVGGAPTPPVEIAEYLLPMNDLGNTPPGLGIDLYLDTPGAVCGKPKTPDIQPPQSFIPNNGNVALDPVTVRAVVITLRARTMAEDPEFFISTYPGTNGVAKNIGIDLDGIPASGLAHVRVERTVIELRNLGLNTLGL